LKTILSVVDSVERIPTDIQRGNLPGVSLGRVTAHAEIKHDAVPVGGCVSQVDIDQVQPSCRGFRVFVALLVIA